MGIASRFGKLRVGAEDDGSRWTRFEDLLTADVFGALRYMPASLGLGALLGAATNADGDALREWAIARGIRWAALTRATIAFWPRLAGKEPDLVVLFHDDGGVAVLAVLVEAKLHDGQHPIEGLSQLGFYGRALVADELDDDAFDEELPTHRPLVFLTSSRTPPIDELHVARDEIGDGYESGRTDVFWTSWWQAAELTVEAFNRRAAEGAAAHELAVLEDLAADLQERGFAPKRELTTFPLPVLAPLDAFPSPWLAHPTVRVRALADLTLPELPAIDGALRQWRLR